MSPTTNYDKDTGASGTLRISVTYTQNATNNTTTFTVKLIVLCSDGSTNFASANWRGIISGSDLGVATFSWASGTTSKTLYSNTYTRTHDANGNLSETNRSFTFNIGPTGTSGMGGPTSHSITIAIPRIPAAPGAPGWQTPPVTVTGPTEAVLNWTAAARGHADIANYAWEVSLTSGGVPVKSGSAGTALTATVTGLTPGTPYFVRVRAINADGLGPWSAVQSFSTLSGGPPSVAVTPAESGKSAYLALTPPGGTTGVTSYDVERRVQGQPTVTAFNVPGSTNISGLTPGVVYEWRAAAWYGAGTYRSPFSDWVAVQQPNPNTGAGDYFDGNTPDTATQDFQWTGTTNNSTSQSVGAVPQGWSFGVDVSGGTAILMRAVGAVGGALGGFSARLVVKTDATAAGLHVGIARNLASAGDVEPNSTYWGSVFALPSRDQRLAAVIYWLDAAGTVVGSTVGLDTLVLANATQRLSVIGIAPANAQWGSVQVVDVAGAGWSTWKGGDTLQLDGAMLSLNELYPYFDGSTPDTIDYTYDWVGTANASPSTRTPGVGSTFDPLADPDCAVVPVPPRPPSVPSDCIEDITVWRRYWSSIPASEISEWLTMLPTIELTTGCNPDPVTGDCQGVRQVRIRVYANPFNYPVSMIDPTSFCSEQIVSYIPPNTVMTIDGPTQRVYADVKGAGGTLAADHLLYGTGGTPATWPELSCGIPYLFSVDVPGDVPYGPSNIRVLLTQRT